MALSERTKEILKSGYDYQGLALDMYEDKCDNCIELQKRIDKAIEYITHEWFKREQIGISHLSFSYDELQHILDILRGEDNESN